jgi:hypothetical protein
MSDVNGEARDGRPTPTDALKAKLANPAWCERRVNE